MHNPFASFWRGMGSVSVPLNILLRYILPPPKIYAHCLSMLPPHTISPINTLLLNTPIINS